MIEIGLWLDSIPESFDTHLLPGLQHGRASLHAAWLSLCVCVCAWVRCKVAILFNTLNSIRILALCALYLPLSSCPSPTLSFSLPVLSLLLCHCSPILLTICHLPFAWPVKVIRKMQFSHGTWDKSEVKSLLSKGARGRGAAGVVVLAKLLSRGSRLSFSSSAQFNWANQINGKFH